MKDWEKTRRRRWWERYGPWLFVYWTGFAMGIAVYQLWFE